MTNKSPIDNPGDGNIINQQKLMPEQRKEELTKCILSQYRLCAAGTIGGAGFSVLRSQSVRPTAWPMLGGAVSVVRFCVYITLCVVWLIALLQTARY